MNNQLYFSFKDILKKKYIIILLIMELLFTLLFFSFTSQQVIKGISKLNMIKDLNGKDITYFTLDGNMAQYTSAIDEILKVKWDNNEAFTIIEYEKLAEYPEYNLIITLGAFDNIFGLSELYSKNSNETVAYIGNKVNKLKIGDTINFGLNNKGTAKVISSIPKKMNYFIGERTQSFENTIVISTNIDYYKKLFIPAGIIENTFLIDSNKSFLMEYMKDLQKAGGNYTAHSLNQYGENIQENFINDGLFSAIVFLFVLVFVFINLIILIMQIIDSNKREYSIHLLYGATFKDIFIRTFLSISYILIPTLLISNYIISDIFLSIKFSIVTLIVIYIITTLALSIISTYNIKEKNLEDYFERNE